VPQRVEGSLVVSRVRIFSPSCFPLSLVILSKLIDPSRYPFRRARRSEICGKTGVGHIRATFVGGALRRNFYRCWMAKTRRPHPAIGFRFALSDKQSASLPEARKVTSKAENWIRLFP